VRCWSLTTAVAAGAAACHPEPGIPQHPSLSHTAVVRTTFGGTPVAVKTKDGGAPAPTKRNDRLRSGLITLGAAYVGTVIGGQIVSATFDPIAIKVGGPDVVNQLMIPIVGPWLALGYNESTVRNNCSRLTPPMMCSDGVITAASIGSGIGGVAQLVGLAITVSGLFHTTAKPESGLTVIPQANPSGGGLAVLGRF
jgi:hypothetical protein